METNIENLKKSKNYSQIFDIILNYDPEDTIPISYRPNDDGNFK